MSNLFSEEFIEKLPADPLEAMSTIIEHASTAIRTEKRPTEQFELAGQAYALFREYSNAFAPQFSPHLKPDLDPGNKTKSIQTVLNRVEVVREQIETERTAHSVQSFEDRAKALIRKIDAIEFTDGDLGRLQELINEMRELTSQTEELEERHRQRILDRLEKLQAELHKRVTKLDEAWLLLPEVGMALGRFGKNAGPMWDRLNETLRIVVGAEARRAELPSNYEPPFLPKLNPDETPDDEDSGD